MSIVLIDPVFQGPDWQNNGASGPIRPLLPDVFTEADWAWLQGRFGMSQRQIQTARLICRGGTNEAIANRLRLSEATVRMHTDAVYKRVGVRSRLGLLVRLIEARRNGTAPNNEP